MLPIEPIAIWESGHTKRPLTTIEGAARCLALEWPGDRSLPSYIAACKACLAAFEGRGLPAQVREAIVKAAKDAGILA